MPRYVLRSIQVLLDIALLSLAYWGAFLFRFEMTIPSTWAHAALVGWPYVLAVTYAYLLLFGVHRYSWRYVSMRETGRIALTVGLSSAMFVTLRLTMVDRVQLVQLPLGVLGSNFFLAFFALVGVRALRRVIGEAKDRRRRAAGRAGDRVLLIGAGEAGIAVLRELAARPDLGIRAVGFIDDDLRKLGTRIGGLTVFGTTDEVARIAAHHRVERVLITIANASGADIRRIVTKCRDAKLTTKIIPGLYELVGHRASLTHIREVAIEDLLGRDPVTLDETQIQSSICGQVVMVTGAGGSIGSELCRQVCRYSPARLVLVERFENALFEIDRELRAAFPQITIDARVADVTDRGRMEQLFKTCVPSIVIHAAAHKHVPMMEANPGEAVKNNVGGTRVVADLSDEYGVQRFVMVSTDKAVNPTSVMGATKRVAEIYVQALGQQSKTRFVTVRFGNVLGSNGSVIPIFKEQIARGGPVTVTHPEMKRYFMTIPEASQLVLQAGSMGQGGEIFILDMGEPVKIVDLARDLITLSGLTPDRDIEIRFAGVRPGEKLFEELATDAEHTDKTKHPKIFIGRIKSTAWQDASRGVEDLITQATSDLDRMRATLRTLVPEYTDPTKASESTTSKPARRGDASGSFSSIGL